MVRSFQNIVLVCLFCTTCCAAAADSPLTLSGFATLGLARASDGEAEVIRDLTQSHGIGHQWDARVDSVLGLQAKIRLSKTLAATVQAISRMRYDNSSRPELTWANLIYTPDSRLTLRAGRLGSEFYMLADSRFIGFSYLTVRPPIDYYSTLPFSYFDGADLEAVTPAFDGLLRFKLYGGWSSERASWDSRYYDMSGSLLLGGYLDYLRGAWQVRLGHTAARMARGLPLPEFYDLLPASISDELDMERSWLQFTSLGMVYDANATQVQLMLSKTMNEARVYQNTWAGYIQASHRFGDLTPFIGVSAAKSSIRKTSMTIRGVTDAFQRLFHTNQKSIFAGLRWDLTERVSLKAQIDLIRGKDSSLFLYRRKTPDWDGTTNVYSLSVNTVF